MASTSRRNGASAEGASKRKNEPGDDAKPNGQRGRNGEIRSQREFGINQHRQHVDVRRQRKRRPERTRGFFQADIELLYRGHNGENDARDGEIQIAEKQAVDRIGKDQLLAKQSIGEIADQALSSGEENDQEADYH